MTSRKKIQANRDNSGRSTGPRTDRGKKAVRYNALKLGYYAHDLIVRPEFQEELVKLEKDLRAQLQPNTALREIKFKEVLHWAWHCELAARLDTRYINAALFPPDDKELPPETGRPPLMDGWFGASRQSLRNGIQFLESLGQTVQEKGYLPEELKAEVRSAFGARFAELLAPPPSPISLTTLLLADHLAKHAKAFKRPLPNVPTEALGEESPKRVIDPQQSLQSILNTIELMQEFLEDLRRINGQSESQVARATASDSPPRHFVHATRALQRAIESYRYLVEHGL